MSGLSLISGYSSTSEESDTEIQEKQSKRIKLQLPDLSSIPVVSINQHLDDPTLHGGRKRSFPHVRGNWATFVYINYPEEETLQILVDKLLTVLNYHQDICNKCDNFHLSLSKTVVLQYHQITTFKESLQEVFIHIKSFELEFSSINIYCNEDNSRTFLSLDVDNNSKEILLNLIKKVNGVLGDFRLPLFYESPSFHISLMWFNGNKKEELTKFLEDLNSVLKEGIENDFKPVPISALNCKIGNKFYQFNLMKDD